MPILQPLSGKIRQNLLNLARFFVFFGDFMRFRTDRHWEVGSKLGSFWEVNFCFFKTVFATVFFLLQIVVHFLRFGKDIFFRVVGIAPVYGGSLNVFIPRMPVPKHDYLAGNAAFLAPCNEGVTKFVRVMFGEQSLERGAQGIDVDVLCLLEVHEVLHLFEHRGERYVPQGDVPSHAFLARFAFEGIAVNDL